MTEKEFRCFLGESLRAIIREDVFYIEELGVIAFALYTMGDDGLMSIDRNNEKIEEIIEEAIGYRIFKNVIKEDELCLTLGEKLKWLLGKYKLDKNSEQEKEYIPLTPYNIDDFAFTPEEIEDFDDSWLIKDFIPNQSLGMIYAEVGSGKSTFAVFLALYLLKNNTINEVFYLDADNSIVAIKKRKGDRWLKLANGKLVYLSSERIDNFNKKNLIVELVESIKNEPRDYLKGKLIIFDSLEEFIGANCEIMPILRSLLTLRDLYGANVIFLHHQPKQPLNKDENNGSHKKSPSFVNFMDYTYHLSSKKLSDDKMLILLKAIKSRNLEKNQAFILDNTTLSLEFVNYDDYIVGRKKIKGVNNARSWNNKRKRDKASR